MPTSHSDLDATRIQQQLTTQVLGRTVHIHAVTSSTNDDIRAAAIVGAPEGLIVLADHQTNGRGQHGRSWVDHPHAQLMASLLLRPSNFALPHTTHLINAFVLTLADTLTPLVTAPVTLKWPNDVLINHRKVAGVLGEARIVAHHLASLCIGWGVNVTAYPTIAVDGVDLAQRTTDVATWATHPVDRIDLLIRQLNAFEHVYAQIQRDPLAYHDRWYAAMSPIIGQTRTIHTGTHTIHGTVSALNGDGSIVIAGHTVHAGMLVVD